MGRLFLVLGLFLIAAVAQLTFTIGEWEQGLLLQFGSPRRILQEPGLYFKLPFVQTLVRLDKRVLSTDARTAEYLTLDKKRVLVDHVSRWRIRDPLEFYRSIRDQQRAWARLDDLISARLRQETAKHNFLDFVREKREDISNGSIYRKKYRRACLPACGRSANASPSAIGLRVMSAQERSARMQTGNERSLWPPPTRRARS
jgi:membrane protease subunit HflC